MDRNSMQARNRRSMLVFSALAGDRWSEAMRSPADMVLFDLEDGTADDRKDEARAAIMPRFSARHEGAPLRLLRINSPRTLVGVRDLVALGETSAPPDGVVIPKVGHPEEVRWVADVITSVHPALELIPLIEDQAGARAVHEIALAAPNVTALFLGSVDYSGELRTDMSWDALYDVRAAIVRAASAASIDCIDGPWLDVHDEAGLREEVARVARMGFTGKASYDASQVEPIHAALTPSAEEIDRARRIVDAVRASAVGGAIVDGRSVNKANAKGAERVLARARRLKVI